MDNNLYNKYIKDGAIINSDELPDFIFQEQLSIYEVMRVENTIALFGKEHYARLCNSAKLNNIEIPGKDTIDKSILLLCKECSISNGNIKIIVSWNKDEMQSDYYIYFVPHYYPSPQEYAEGIKCITYHTERDNPQSKTINMAYRNALNDAIQSRHAFEALLINDKAMITEGSRSNAFFIIENTVFTCQDEYVLAGITREKIISICHSLHIPLQLKAVTNEDLQKVDAAFISGTSPKVLPIKQINHIQLQPQHPLIQKIAKAYDLLISDHFKLHL